MFSTAMRASLCALVRQQNAARNVADGVNGRVVRLLPVVDLDEALFIERDLRVFESEVRRCWGRARRPPARGSLKFLNFLPVEFHRHFDPLACRRHLHTFALSLISLNAFFAFVTT